MRQTAFVVSPLGFRSPKRQFRIDRSALGDQMQILRYFPLQSRNIGQFCDLVRIVSSSSICAEFFMQKTSRAPPAIAKDSVERNVVRLARRSASTRPDDTVLPGEVARLTELMERASNAVRQLRYFGLATKRFTLGELISSAVRAGFVLKTDYPQLKEASFQWGAGAADLIFTASYRDAAQVSIVAESQADVFGLILTSYSQTSIISVETNPTIEDEKLGENALLFRDMLLTFPGFYDVPAWTTYPEITAPKAGGLIEMWRDGICVASVFERTRNSISARVSSVWNALRDRS
jgi:hypothetical protein